MPKKINEAELDEIVDHINAGDGGRIAFLSRNALSRLSDRRIRPGDTVNVIGCELTAVVMSIRDRGEGNADTAVELDRSVYGSRSHHPNMLRLVKRKPQSENSSSDEITSTTSRNR